MASRAKQHGSARTRQGRPSCDALGKAPPGEICAWSGEARMPSTTSMIPSTNSQKTHHARGTQNHASADEGVAVCGFCTSPFGEFNSIPWRVVLGVRTAGLFHLSCDQCNRRSLLWLARKPHLAVQLRYCTWGAIRRGACGLRITGVTGIDRSLLDLSLQAKRGICSCLRLD